MKAYQGVDQGKPSRKGPGIHHGPEPAVAGSLQLLRVKGQLQGALSFLLLCDRKRFQMAQSPRRQAEELYLGSLQSGVEASRRSNSADYGAAATTPGVCVRHCSARKRVQPRNRMREIRTSGTVRGALGNRRSYRESQIGLLWDGLNAHSRV